MVIGKLPEHVAVIMDGNGRWAQKRGLSRTAGHRAGVKALKRMAVTLNDYGVKILTVFAFSTENWKRPEEEINGLFKMIIEFNRKVKKEVGDKNIKICFMGNISELPDEVKNSIREAELNTECNTGLILNVALNYGGRQDILQAINKMLVEKVEKVNDVEMLSRLQTSNLPLPDLILRTGGEKRLSNFMLYQAAYAELVFRDTLWPDFDKKEIESVLEEFAERHRRFGAI